MKHLIQFVNEDSGQDLIEYASVAALVGLGAVAAMKGELSEDTPPLEFQRPILGVAS
jgi:Flp pilus assembly pilin Flp